MAKISFVCKFSVNISLTLSMNMLFVQTSKRSSSLPKTDMEVELTHCQCEVDITLVDRIHALLNPRPFTTRPTSSVYRSFQYSVPLQVSCNHPFSLITEFFGCSAQWKELLILLLLRDGFTEKLKTFLAYVKYFPLVGPGL